MRIGIFTCNYKPLSNGVVTSIASYVEQFNALGHETFVFAPRYPSLSKSQPESNVYRFPSLSAPTHHSYALPIPCSLKIRTEIGRLGLDVIHAQHPFLLGPYAFRTARRLKLPLVFTYHTRYDLYGHYSPVLPRLSSKLALNQSLRFAGHADAVVALTRASAEMLRAYRVRTRIELIPSGISPQKPTNDLQALRDRLGIPSSARIILYVGRLAKEKNLYLLLNAFALVVRQVKRAMLVIVGEGDEKQALMDFADRLDLRGKALFVGEVPRDEVWDYYGLADIFALPSTSEVQPLAPLEALACGRAVVAVRYPGIEDYISDGVEGYLASESPQDFADKILFLLKNDEILKALSMNSLEKARMFSAERSARRMLKLYDELIGQAACSSHGINFGHQIA